jgi:pimeloyl-ACP methyl ester carboxylesterase
MVDNAQMTRETRSIDVDGARLAADLWPAGDESSGAPVVLLHAGICDRRSWYTTAERLTGLGPVLAYDRRGFGETRPGAQPFRHVHDLLSVLEQSFDEPAWLVGSSMGGGVALDTALAAPERVAGLVLLAPAVTGAPDDGDLDADTQLISDLLDAADAAGDSGEVNRLEAWLWLDGPAGPEGRVGGPARDLTLAMNAIVLGHGVAEDAGSSEAETWPQLGAVKAPTTVAWGDLDLPFIRRRCRSLAELLPQGRGRVLPGTAHLPYLEQPESVAGVIRDALLP